MTKLVIHTNKYLQDPEARARMILQSARSSSAIEGIHKPFAEGRPKPIARAKRECAVFPQR
ncbi:MAG: hypothetical protein IT303_03325 [Dehalococcoidia bacterium]|nr:hypothetical protein [Dehalococcoidia bacterium]